jgi:hypothetical protein
MQGMKRWLGVFALGVASVVGWQVWSIAQQPAAGKAKEAAGSNRLEFEVVQSFDAKYLGDTPGHLGRAGGLENRRLRIALGDSIYRGEEKVGVVTGLEWIRTHGSLNIEFDPVDHARVCVGDAVWTALDDRGPGIAEPQRSK